MTLEEIELQIIGCCGPRHCNPGDHDYECCVHHNPMLAERIAAALKAAGARADKAGEAIRAAVTLICEYGNVNGNAQRAWLMDGVVRALLMTEEAYATWLVEMAGEHGWNKGQAPYDTWGGRGTLHPDEWMKYAVAECPDCGKTDCHGRIHAAFWMAVRTVLPSASAPLGCGVKRQ